MAGATQSSTPSHLRMPFKGIFGSVDHLIIWPSAAQAAPYVALACDDGLPTHAPGPLPDGGCALDTRASAGGCTPQGLDARATGGSGHLPTLEALESRVRG